jgi:hypothetical protein
MDRHFLQIFDGPRGRSELYEIVGFNFDQPHIEHVEYEVIHRGGRFKAMTMGEAAIVGCELAGDNRFLRPTMPAPRRRIALSPTLSLNR